MSVQFGTWNFDGQQVVPEYLEKVITTLAPYGPDSNERYSNGGVTILYHAFHTTKESHREVQPHISPSGAVIAWDGRLDNRQELISELHDSLTIDSTDVAIVAAVYERWGGDCFGKLIGDWAISIWNPGDHSLILAKDPIGTRHLYYAVDSQQVRWSTVLEPLVLFAGKTFALNEEYIAGWFSYFPSAHLTPYVGIHGVPPSSCVLLKSGAHNVSKYWDFDPGKKIRHRTDAEYEDRFRNVFAKAVQRRLRSDRPVLAELSGGMDSSAIVCMADTVIARAQAECPRLDTISWYDESQPATNELPFFTKVEEKRGRIGCHIDLSTRRDKSLESKRSPTSLFEGDSFEATPISGDSHNGLFEKYRQYMRSQGHRVTITGIAGESATGGGLPTPTPELQDLLVRARFLKLAARLNAWAIKMRRPRLPVLWEAVRLFFFPAPVYAPKGTSLASWLDEGFVSRNYRALCGYSSRVKLFGPLPSFQESLRKFDAERKLVAFLRLESKQLREIRFPYLDRDLLEFMYAIPREQVVRVGQRRSLMRRALVGIVPDELLNRKQRGFTRQELANETATEPSTLTYSSEHLISTSMGLINRNRFLEALQKGPHDEEACIGSIICTLTMESWLRHLMRWGVLMTFTSKNIKHCSHLNAEDLQPRAQPQEFS